MKSLLTNLPVLKEGLAILGLMLDAMMIFGVVDAARGNTARGAVLIGLYFLLGYAHTKLWFRFYEATTHNGE